MKKVIFILLFFSPLLFLTGCGQKETAEGGNSKAADEGPADVYINSPINTNVPVNQNLNANINTNTEVNSNTNINANTNSATSVKEPIFFYSDSCGHCQKVKDYIAENNIKNIVSYSEVEAFATEESLNLFNEKSAFCGIAEDSRGVPLVFENGKCYFGQFEAIDFLKKKAGL